MAYIILALPLKDLGSVCENGIKRLLPIEFIRTLACINDCFTILVVTEISQQVVYALVKEHKW